MRTPLRHQRVSDREQARLTVTHLSQILVNYCTILTSDLKPFRCRNRPLSAVHPSTTGMIRETSDTVVPAERYRAYTGLLASSINSIVVSRYRL